jgi:hypothetical protein
VRSHEVKTYFRPRRGNALGFVNNGSRGRDPSRATDPHSPKDGHFFRLCDLCDLSVLWSLLVVPMCALLGFSPLEFGLLRLLRLPFSPSFSPEDRRHHPESLHITFPKSGLSFLSQDAAGRSGRSNRSRPEATFTSLHFVRRSNRTNLLCEPLPFNSWLRKLGDR